jgi:D-alanyl-D-alanine dipeptidase
MLNLYPEISRGAGQVQGWKAIPIKEDAQSDPLVPLGPSSPEAAILMTSSVYFGEHSNSPYAKHANRLEGSLLALFARQSVARRLVAAERLLPAGHHLLVFDAYRPYRVQKSLYDLYRHQLERKHPDMDDAVLESEAQKYGSLPSVDPARPSPHSTGGAIDAVIIRLDRAHEQELSEIRCRLAGSNLNSAQRVGMELRLSAVMRRHGKMLWFGTAFDHGSEKSALAYYESTIVAGKALTENDMIACNNRRLLYMVMTQAGFQPYFAEWWHFNAPESQMGAATAGRRLATRGAASLDASNRAHENARLSIRQEALKLLSEQGLPARQTALQTEILATIAETGDLRIAEHWPTEIIAPWEG